MESRKMAERIDDLLTEADEIERAVETVQVERPSSWAPEDVMKVSHNTPEKCTVASEVTTKAL